MTDRRRTKERWELLTIASPAGVSYRIFYNPANGDPCQDIAHIPMAWSGDGSRARLMVEAPALVEALDDMIAEQNGPPLVDPRHERAWQRAMDNAAAVLARI